MDLGVAVFPRVSVLPGEGTPTDARFVGSPRAECHLALADAAIACRGTRRRVLKGVAPREHSLGRRVAWFERRRKGKR